MAQGGLFQLYWGEGPVITTAIHDGHAIRPELEEFLALDEETRLREEDPLTGLLTDVVATRIIGLRSRFEVDLNRPREKAVYLRPEDAWGLQVWSRELPAEMVGTSLALHDQFYALLRSVCEAKAKQYRSFAVLDLHSYNHRREGPEGCAADPSENPEINVGTGTVDKKVFGRLVDRFLNDLRQCSIESRPPDVRENVKFRGGYLSQWINQNFPGRGVALANRVQEDLHG